MIIASVVLPSPGGPESSTWSGAPAAAPGRLQHQAELLADPLLADDLVERARPQRRLDRALVAVRLGRGQRSWQVGGPPRASSVGLVAIGPSPQALLKVRSAARSSAATSGVVAGLGRDRVDRLVGLLGRPAEADQALRAPGPARLGAGGRRAGPAVHRPGAPIRSLSSRMIRWAPFCPMPGTRVSVLTSSAATAAPQRRRARAPRASPGPAWARPRRRSAPARRSASRPRRAKPNRVSESSRTTMLVGSVAGWPDAQRRRACRGCTCSSRPTPPTSRTALVRATSATSPRTNAIIGSSLPGRSSRRGRRRSGPGRRRARCG